MKWLFLINLLLVGIWPGLKVRAQDMEPVDKESKVAFTVKNFGINTGGRFSGLQGKIRFNAASLSTSYFDVRVTAETIDTDIAARDRDLRKEKYLHVERYPFLSFRSLSISSSNRQNSYLVAGRLTIKGTTREISFPFTATQSGAGYLFQGSFTIDRRDYKVGGSSIILGDAVQVDLKVFAR